MSLPRPRTRTLLALCVLAGCGGGQAATKPVEEPADPGPAPGTQDLAFEIDGAPIAGYYFAAEALFPPSIPPMKLAKRSLAEQRKRHAKAAGDAKVAEGTALAHMLLGPGKPDQQKEALELLRGLAAGGKAPEETVLLLAAVEGQFGDRARAGAAFAELLARFPQSPDLLNYRVLRGGVGLASGDNAAAAKVVDGLDPAAADTAPELAWIAAWVRFRAGDAAGAHAAIDAAARRWRIAQVQPALQRDALVMTARIGVAVAAALATLDEAASAGEGKARRLDKKAQRELRDKLAEAYKLAGQYARRAELYDELARDAGPGDLPAMRFQQADAEYRLNHPDRTAARALEAWAAVQKGGDAVVPDVQSGVAQLVGQLAQVYHSIYVASFDGRYAEPAKQLYGTYLAIPGRPDTEEMRKHLADLEATIGMNMAAARQGLHDQNEVQRRILARREELVACYEQALQGNPTLEGKLALTFDVSIEGKVTAASVDKSAAGALAATGACMAERIKQWTFSSRGKPGLTRVVYRVAVAPAKK